MQLQLPKTGGWGGKRKGAGRKRHTELQSRVRRPEHPARHPLHVTLRLRRDVPSLRERRRFKPIKRAFRHGCDRFGMRVCEFSVQYGHFHLVVEAADKRALARGMQGLEVRLAREINRMFGRRGPVFEDRYHARALRTPTVVKNTVHYVRYNMQKHRAERGLATHDWALDAFSSVSGEACWYDDKHGTIALPQTWLLKNAPS